MKFKLVVLSIIILAALLRLVKLDGLPPALNWDEVSIGYNANSILQTGKDEWGQVMPLSFRAYGDYKLPGYVYLDVPFVGIFGLNEWGVRLPSALLGIGLSLLTILILKKLSDIHSASWSGFLAAILPWSIILSRIALEAQLALFLTTVSFYFFILSLEKRIFLIFSAISFGLTIFSYNSSRIVTPLLILVLTIIYWSDLKKIKKTALGALLIFAVFFGIALPNALLQDSSARYKWTTILDQGAINHIDELRGSSALPSILTKISYNRVTYVVPEVIKNYASHFNPDFLFIDGGSNFQFSVPGSGLVYPIFIPFLLLGFYQIFKERQKWQLAILSWLLIAPMPAAITRDSPHALRAIMMIIPLVMIASLGLAKFVEHFHGQKKMYLIKWSLIGVFLISLIFFWQSYAGDYTKNYSWSWQYGYKQAVNYIKQNGNKYQTIYFTKKYGEPHEFLLFYLGYDPAKYLSDPNLVRYFKSDWYWVDSFDKYVFVNDWEVLDRVKNLESRVKEASPTASEQRVKESGVKNLLITTPGNYPAGVKKLETIDFLNGKPAFDIVEL